MMPFVTGWMGLLLAAGALHITVALMWLVPDRRIARAIDGCNAEPPGEVSGR